MNHGPPSSLAGLLTVAILAALAIGCNEKVEQANDNPNQQKAEQETQPKEGESESGVRKWASKNWNNAISAGSQTADDTGEWVSKMYESAKEAGTTSATSASDWVKEDWSAQGDWEYQIMQLDSTDIPAVQKALNEVGRSRWNCYHVERTEQQWTFFMKRTRYSYLSKLPLRDLTNILPRGSGNGDGE